MFPWILQLNSIYGVVVLRSHRESMCKKKRVKAGVVFSPGKVKKRGWGVWPLSGRCRNDWNISLFTSVQESSASVKAGL